MKVVINACFGGFGLSDKAFKMLIEMGWTVTKYNKKGGYENEKADIVKHKGKIYGDYSFAKWDERDIKLRTHPDLIKVVELFGKSVNEDCAKLKVIKIPNNVKVEIEEYDGNEWVAEKHRTWS